MKMSHVCIPILASALAACSSSPKQIANSTDAESTVAYGTIEFRTYLTDPNRLEVSRELREVDESIDKAEDARRLSDKEAREGRKQVKVLAREADRLTRGGLTDMEARSLAISARGVESLISAPSVKDRPELPKK